MKINKLFMMDNILDVTKSKKNVEITMNAMFVLFILFDLI